MSEFVVWNPWYSAYKQRIAAVYRRVKPIFLLWLVLRIALSSLALIASLVAPRTVSEQQIHVWPVAVPSGAWLERVLLLPWQRWDVNYYLAIATQGYRADDGTAQFHPLYPLLGRVAGTLMGGNELLGLLVVSSLSSVFALVCFEQLALLDLPSDMARRATIYFAIAPISFILFAPYTEALFLLCSIVALWMARQQRWWFAGLAGALAVLTRQQGIFLLVPLLWELWMVSQYQWPALFARWRSLLALLLLPAALLAWIVYRAVALSDVIINLEQPHTLIYSFLISKSSAQVVPVQGFLPPWQTLRAAFISLNGSGSQSTLIELVMGGVVLLLFILGWRLLWRLRPSYLLYTFVILLVSFSYYTGPSLPYMGLQRHCLLAFPIFLPLAIWGRWRIVNWAVLFYASIGTIILVVGYVSLTWVP